MGVNLIEREVVEGREFGMIGWFCSIVCHRY